MDIKQYYRKLREMEESLTDEFLLLVSLETPDGGKPGVVSEVARPLAAKLLVEGRSALANEQERQAYRRRQLVERKAAEQAKLARTVQVAILSDAEFRTRPSRKNSAEPNSGK